MALLSFKEIHRGRDADDEVTKHKAIRRYTRVFRATTSSATDEGTVILDNAQCPQPAEPYPEDAEAYCRRRRCVNESFSKTVWLITCAYTTEAELDDNPLNDPARIEWTTEQFQRPYFKDRHGNAILNSAGDYYDPPVEGDDSRWVAVVTKNLATAPAWVLQYRDAINSDAFTIDDLLISAGWAKMQAIRISEWMERNDVDYRVVTMTIAFNEDGWAKEVLDQGFRECDTCETICGSEASTSACSGSSASGGECISRRRHILDANCDPVVSPVPLDGAGCALTCPTPESAVFRTHHIYKIKAFATLPLT